MILASNPHVIPISALKDNYIWLIVNDQLGEAIAVDPGESAHVLHYLESHQLRLTAILVTHKHADHTGGISDLLAVYSDVAVYAHPKDNVVATTHSVMQDDIVNITSWPISFKVMHIPGHTLGHVAYYSPPMLFTGDTLFGAGCGRVFEGTAEQMLSSLNQLSALPDDTLIYCGHEYTLANLNFALKVDPESAEIVERIKLTEQLRAENKPSLPSTMGAERKTNPFLRCTNANIITSVEQYAGHKLTQTVDVFHELREWKNNV